MKKLQRPGGNTVKLFLNYEGLMVKRNHKNDKKIITRSILLFFYPLHLCVLMRKKHFTRFFVAGIFTLLFAILLPSSKTLFAKSRCLFTPFPIGEYICDGGVIVTVLTFSSSVEIRVPLKLLGLVKLTTLTTFACCELIESSSL